MNDFNTSAKRSVYTYEETSGNKSVYTEIK